MNSTGFLHFLNISSGEKRRERGSVTCTSRWSRRALQLPHISQLWQNSPSTLPVLDDRQTRTPIETPPFITGARLYVTDAGLSQSASSLARLPTWDGLPSREERVACTLFTSRLADSCSSAFPTAAALCVCVSASCPELLWLWRECPACRGRDVLLNEGEPLDAARRMNSITGRVLAIPAASVTNSGASSSRALHVDLTSQQVNTPPGSSRWHQGEVKELRQTQRAEFTTSVQ